MGPGVGEAWRIFQTGHPQQDSRAAQLGLALALARAARAPGPNDVTADTAPTTSAADGGYWGMRRPQKFSCTLLYK